MKSKSWTTIQRHVLLRDGYQCQTCGDIAPLSYDGALYVHHVVYRSQGGPDDPANAVTLCDLCHGVIHGSRSGTGFRSFHCMKDKRCQRVFCRRENIMTGSADSPLINERKCRRRCGSNSASGVRSRHGIDRSNALALQNDELLEILFSFVIPPRSAEVSAKLRR